MSFVRANDIVLALLISVHRNFDSEKCQLSVQMTLCTRILNREVPKNVICPCK
jgi:hypothetical protein